MRASLKTAVVSRAPSLNIIIIITTTTTTTTTIIIIIIIIIIIVAVVVVVVVVVIVIVIVITSIGLRVFAKFSEPARSKGLLLLCEH